MEKFRIVLFLLGTYFGAIESLHPELGFGEIEFLLNSKNIFSDAAYISVKDVCKLSVSNDSRSIMSTLGCIINDQNTLRLLYENYKAQYSILKPSNVSRLQIFHDEILTIAQHNIEARLGHHSWEMGVNFFTEMTDTERSEFTSCYKDPTLVTPNTIKSSLEEANTNWIDGWTLAWEWFYPKNPVEVDWRSAGHITPVKTQGSCGSCWAFSTTGAVEAYISMKTGRLVNISAQNLLECAVKENACSGVSTLEIPYKYAQIYGLSLEDDYPYNPSHVGHCKHETIPIYSKIRFQRPVSGNERKLQSELTEHPVSVAICSSTFSRYAKGIFNDCATCTRRDHAVLAVGYGSQGGMDYWLIKNSWSQTWGEGGYLRIQRNANNMCMIAGNGRVPYWHHEDLVSKTI